MSTLLEVEDLAKSYPVKRDLIGRPSAWLHAVKGVSFKLEAGRTIAIVGESGAGKSTVGRLVLRLIEPTRGSIRLNGEDVRTLKGTGMHAFRRRAQMIFQDPFSSLDPRMVVGGAVGEALAIHRALRGWDQEQAAAELLARVGLNPEYMDRYPHEFSGGQLQRIAIARALAAEPDLIVCDEPVAALDVSIRAQVLNLLLDLQQERGISYLFISHDLSLVRFFAHDVIVMKDGEIVEQGAAEDLFQNPRHPYTQALVAAAPVAQPSRQQVRAALARS